MLDYATLRVIWWVLLGLLLIGFAITDGFDLGIGMILLRVARTDDERRIVLNTIGPVLEGNQMWLILAAGTIFAAWPEIYAVAFSGLYFAIIGVLMALIIRPVGFKYRSKLASLHWRYTWDKGIFIAGFIPTFLFGIAMGNTIEGVPFYYDLNLQSYYTGTFLQLLNPFALLCGLLTISLFIMHGAIWLAIKTEGIIQTRAQRYAVFNTILSLILFLFASIWICYLKSYQITSTQLIEQASNPLHKKVAVVVGAWMLNFKNYPELFGIPALAFLAGLFAIILCRLRSFNIALLMSAFCMTCMIITAGVGMFPFILPSSSHPDMSLLVWDASSSRLTLLLMLAASAIFIPIIILYTSWVYYVLRGKVTSDYVMKNTKSLY